MADTQRTLVESADYSRQLATLSDLQRLDDALVGVCWALSTNPEVYETVKGMYDVRLLKTDPLGGLPPLRIWFKIDDDDQSVHLLYIEPIADDDE